jgi:hypothetical protein
MTEKSAIATDTEAVKSLQQRAIAVLQCQRVLAHGLQCLGLKRGDQ